MLDKVLAPHLKKKEEEKESERSLRIIKWEMQPKAVDKVLKLQTNTVTGGRGGEGEGNSWVHCNNHEEVPSSSYLLLLTILLIAT